MFYDCHTYKKAHDSNIVAIVNYKSGDVRDDHLLYSVGIHPWRAADDDFVSFELRVIEGLANRENVVAIGECGLDKLYANIERQKDIFRTHIKLANQLRKPLIVHSVRAFSDTETLLDKAEVPVIFHGVNNKINKLEFFLSHSYFFSFGAALLLKKSVVRDTLLSIPDDLLLLETDESEVSIQDVYHEAAQLKGITIDALVLQVERNIKEIFKWE
ncbi:MULTISPECIES: TatD family hydrolase [Chitinophagaceae]